MKINTKNWIEIISVVISIFALFYSWNANIQAQTANSIASQANLLAHDNNELIHQVNLYEINATSYKFASEIYDKIYDRGINQEVINKLMANEKVKNEDNLNAVVNLLEDMGAHLCGGRVFQTHAREQIGPTMYKVCNNDQLYNTYKNSRNGIAILCSRLAESSKFAQTIEQTNLNTCRFLDENILLDLRKLNEHSTK